MMPIKNSNTLIPHWYIKQGLFNEFFIPIYRNPSSVIDKLFWRAKLGDHFQKNKYVYAN